MMMMLMMLIKAKHHNLKNRNWIKSKAILNLFKNKSTIIIKDLKLLNLKVNSCKNRSKNNIKNKIKINLKKML